MEVGSGVNGTGGQSWAQWRLGRCGPLEFAGLSVMGLFLAAFQTFDARHEAWWLDVLYWQLAMLGGGVIAALVEPVVYRRLSDRPRLFAVVQTLTMTPPITLWIGVLGAAFHGRVPRPDQLMFPLGSVLVVNAAVVILAWLLRAAMAPRADAGLTSGAAPAEIRAKLAPRLARARLIAIQAEDHYLRVHTEAGSDLILMRLTDALNALRDNDGLQVHRSWWVARGAVQTVQWKKGRGALGLEGGLSAPVSQTFAPAVRAVDWA